jgi:hypothetical protein
MCLYEYRSISLNRIDVLKTERRIESIFLMDTEYVLYKEGIKYLHNI